MSTFTGTIDEFSLFLAQAAREIGKSMLSSIYEVTSGKEIQG